MGGNRRIDYVYSTLGICFDGDVVFDLGGYEVIEAQEIFDMIKERIETLKENYRKSKESGTKGLANDLDIAYDEGALTEARYIFESIIEMTGAKVNDAFPLC